MASITTQSRESFRESGAKYARLLRQELSARAIVWAEATGAAHEQTIGQIPAVLFREDDEGRHGNFFPPSYGRIRGKAEWKRRLGKVHTSARNLLVSHDADRCELDTATSSDALLMSIFCCPPLRGKRSGALYSLLAVAPDSTLRFGYRPRIPLKGTGIDCTEVDLCIDNLYIEAKLTEGDFQISSASRIERYRDAEQVFDLNSLPRNGSRIYGYQVIRGALAAYAEVDRRYCVLCDNRRPDLIDCWFSIMQAVKPFELRSRLQLITWQEVSAELPPALQAWLETKYGIAPLS